jgi:hypothetical protein
MAAYYTSLCMINTQAMANTAKPVGKIDSFTYEISCLDTMQNHTNTTESVLQRYLQ